jgi:hypothetical protein
VSVRRSLAIAILLVAVGAGAQRHRAARSFPPTPPRVDPVRVFLTPSHDATLFQSGNGSLANGSGVHLFAGETASHELRRALLRFDVASKIPAGSRILGAALTLRISQTISGTEAMSIHAVTSDWGEGASNAGASRDGGGTAAAANDATWLHTFFPSKRWTTAGGDFDNNVEATAAALQSGDVTWGPSSAMTARVQSWVDSPTTNFGWIVLGNETAPTTAKRFDSREVASEATRPILSIDYVPPTP